MVLGADGNYYVMSEVRGNSSLFEWWTLWDET